MKDTDGLNPRDAAWLAVEQVRQLNEDLGIPAKLGDVGVKVSAIKSLALGAMASGNVAVNPRKTGQEEFETLFKEAI